VVVSESQLNAIKYILKTSDDQEMTLLSNPCSLIRRKCSFYQGLATLQLMCFEIIYQQTVGNTLDGYFTCIICFVILLMGTLCINPHSYDYRLLPPRHCPQ